MSTAEPRRSPHDVARISRRRALELGAGAVAGTMLAPHALARGSAAAPQEGMIRRAIPSSGEEIPVVGLGTWQTFDVGTSAAERAQLRDVLRSFVDLGGTVVDSSPMYGSSETVLGDLAVELGVIDELWVATKVWTRGESEGGEQMRRSLSELRRPRIELMQVHNLVDVQAHLETLAEWKAAGTFRYIGITTSSTRQYRAMEALMDDDRLDFIQVNYSLGERESAERLLPKARERGLAAMINRPFGGGGLFRRFGGRSLPPWASDFDTSAWSQLFLKYVLSHPAVTVAIPATSDPGHLRENMGGGVGRLPTPDIRRRMEELVRA